jgi:hypothetical protein
MDHLRGVFLALNSALNQRLSTDARMALAAADDLERIENGAATGRKDESLNRLAAGKRWRGVKDAAVHVLIGIKFADQGQARARKAPATGQNTPVSSSE